MYLDIGEFDKGYLGAPDFKPSAIYAVDHIAKKHKKCIKLVPLDDYPINHAATEEEIKIYY
jgi:hypothetical protein